mmetsp:Transcript_13091/g.28851  ORF Transcript_13091/g.28851 Transcript_13091/m.28851 type:complete len:317 (-) Transcript_13091:42-992(-)
MHVATHCDLPSWRDLNLHEGLQGFQLLDHVQDNLISKLLGDRLLQLLPLHQFDAELSCDLAGFVDRALVKIVHLHASHIDRLTNGLGLFASDSPGKFVGRDRLLTLLQLLPGILVLRRQLADLHEVLESILRPSQRQVRRSAPVPALGEIRLSLDGFCSVEQSVAGVLHLKVAEGSVRVVDGQCRVRLLLPIKRIETVILIDDAKVDGLCVSGQGLGVVTLLELLVPGTLGLLGLCPHVVRHATVCYLLSMGQDMPYGRAWVAAGLEPHRVAVPRMCRYPELQRRGLPVRDIRGQGYPRNSATTAELHLSQKCPAR